jgi:hypothetical protein
MPQWVHLILHDPGRVDEVVNAWLELGISGITLLDSSGLARQLGERDLRDDLPMFPSLRSLLSVPERNSRLVFSVVPDDFDLDRLITATERVLGPLRAPDSGILFVVPVTRTVGVRGVDY